jgi:acyl carrier protein
MEQSEVLQELSSIFSEVLELPGLQLKPESDAASVEGWDSLAHINLVIAVEQHYRIKFALGELQDLKNVGEMAALIQRKKA